MVLEIKDIVSGETERGLRVLDVGQHHIVPDPRASQPDHFGRPRRKIGPDRCLGLLRRSRSWRPRRLSISAQ